MITFGYTPQFVKKILVPIDFSPSTKETMDFAIMLADKLGSTSLLVLNVIDFMEKMVGLRSVNQVLQDDAIERLGTFLEPYKKKSKVKILSKIVKGEPFSVISRQAKVNHADLVVIGAQGEDNEEKYFLGKIAGSLIKFGSVPVIAVPHLYKIRDTRKILFMYRKLHKNLFDVINPLLDLARACDAAISSVHLTGAQTGPIAYSTDLIFEEIPHTHTELLADTFTEGINKVLGEDDDIGLVCVLRRKRGFLEHIFESSPTPKSIIDSPVPVLFLNDDE